LDRLPLSLVREMDEMIAGRSLLFRVLLYYRPQYKYDVENLTLWNDVPWRRRDQVVDVLRALAEKTEGEWLREERVRLTAEVERLTAEVERLRAENERLAGEAKGLRRLLRSLRDDAAAEREQLADLEDELAGKWAVLQGLCAKTR
jgi:FtsZ-binding cell division protein ZapB